MLKKLKGLTKEITPKDRNRINKIVLGTFLTIAIFVLLARIITGALLDVGFFHDKFHPGFGKNPSLAFKGSYLNGLTESNMPLNKNDMFYAGNDFLKANPDLQTMIKHHPSFAWFLTQFTGLTTIIIIIYLTFRIFKFEDTIPRGLRGIMTQRTLSLIAMYDIIVGVLFGSSMFTGFSGAFSGSLYGIEMTITIIVHGVIPVFITSYSIIFLIKDEKASMLREFFAMKGLIFPGIYCIGYVLMTITGSDPYPITNMNEKLNMDPVTNTLLENPNGSAGAGELGKLPVVLTVIYVILGFLTILHNFILQRFNKNYDINNDSEIKKLREHKLEKFRRKMIRKAARDINK